MIIFNRLYLRFGARATGVADETAGSIRNVSEWVAETAHAGLCLILGRNQLGMALKYVVVGGELRL